MERVTQKEIKLTGLKKKLVEDEPLFEAQTNYEDLEKSLIQTSKAVIGFVKKKNWNTEEIINLEYQLKPLLS